MPETVYADWNPWHGCTKISPGCKYCYVYRQDEQYGTELASSLCRKTGNFNLPLKNGETAALKFCRAARFLPVLPRIFYCKTPTIGALTAGR